MSGNSGGHAGHVGAYLLDRYAAGATATGNEDAWWAVEAHLERCATCRERLADAVARCNPGTSSVVAEVGHRLRGEVAGLEPGRVRRSRLPGWSRWWARPVLLPRAGMTLLMVLAALGLDLADEAATGRFPSLVLLLAPVTPLLAMAAAWSRGLDPAYELVVASPRAGLEMVLRRTLAVLTLVIPGLAGAGWLAGESPAAWLLPCLAFTTGALALGGVVGLNRAATGLGLAWVLIVVGPSLLAARAPAVLSAASLPWWAAVTALAVLVIAVDGRGYTRLISGR